MTPICRTLAEVRAELLRLRALSRRRRRRRGSGSPPQAPTRSRTGKSSAWPEERYRKLLESYRRLLQQQLAFGFHVPWPRGPRGGARGDESPAPWLAPLLALSASSPSGSARHRLRQLPHPVWGRLPTAGLRRPFFTRRHDALVRALVETGSVLDAASVYWDVRLPEKHDTVEIRVADACSRVDEAVMLAGLSRGLVRSCHERAERGETYPVVRPELLRAAHWHASRHGLDAELIDVEDGRLVPARGLSEKLLAFARPALEENGDWEEVTVLARETLERGNSASRQRRAYERSGRLEDVVDTLIEETAPAGRVVRSQGGSAP